MGPLVESGHPSLPFQLLHAGFTQQQHLGKSSSFMLSVVTVKDQLTLTLCSPQPVIPLHWNALLMAEMLQILHFILSVHSANVQECLEALNVH